MFKPILFNTEMVKAILDGRKTQTRRIVKNQDGIHPRRSNIGFFGWDDGHGYQMMPPCKEGDILWVRECWRMAKGTMHTYIHGEITESDDWHDGYEYRAGGYSFPDGFSESSDDYHLSEIRSGGSWNPSIFMPKEAARIFLRVKDVRIERLQDITDADAHSEGVPEIGDYPINPVYCPRCKGEGLIGGHTGGGYVEVDCPDCRTDVQRFFHLWESTIKPADREWYGWETNPWVWVIEFERCEKPEGWV